MCVYKICTCVHDDWHILLCVYVYMWTYNGCLFFMFWCMNKFVCICMYIREYVEVCVCMCKYVCVFGCIYARMCLHM